MADFLFTWQIKNFLAKKNKNYQKKKLIKDRINKLKKELPKVRSFESKEEEKRNIRLAIKDKKEMLETATTKQRSGILIDIKMLEERLNNLNINK